MCLAQVGRATFASPSISPPTLSIVTPVRATLDDGESAGSIAIAADELEISKATARQHLSSLYGRTRCANAARAAYWLRVAEALREPDRAEAYG
jgi:hypothetical protein